jgi:hypothetical protein
VSSLSSHHNIGYCSQSRAHISRSSTPDAFRMIPESVACGHCNVPRSRMPRLTRGVSTPTYAAPHELSVASSFIVSTDQETKGAYVMLSGRGALPWQCASDDA